MGRKDPCAARKDLPNSLLVIDDSRAVRSIIRGILKEFGFDIIEAANGREALDRLHEIGMVDLALVDWNMPEMNGLEFVQAVRADPTYDDMPMMMVTTESGMQHMILALESGANEYVMKPFTREVLREKIELLDIDLP